MSFLSEIAGYIRAAKEGRLDYPTALMLIEQVVSKARTGGVSSERRSTDR